MNPKQFSSVICAMLLGFGCTVGSPDGADPGTSDPADPGSEWGDPGSGDPGSGDPSGGDPGSGDPGNGSVVPDGEIGPPPVQHAPEIVVVSPARAASLDGARDITVTGTVKASTGTIASLTINGDPVTPAADGSFSYDMRSRQGMNPIVVEAKDDGGRLSRLVQTYYYSTQWIAADPDNLQGSMVSEGFVAWLGKMVIDDDNAATGDDFAAALTRAIIDMDLSQAIPKQHDVGKVAGCDTTVTLSQVQTSEPKLSIKPVDGGFAVEVNIEQLRAHIDADMDGSWYNPACAVDPSGWVSSRPVTATAMVNVSVGSGGNVSAQSSDVAVTLHDLDIDVGGLTGFLFNWVVNFFEDDVARSFERSLEERLNDKMPSVLGKAFGELAAADTFQVAPFFGDGSPATFHAKLGLATLRLDKGGAMLALNGAVAADKQAGHGAPGSIGRAECLGEQSDELSFAEASSYPLQMALRDDLFNQLLFSAYSAGLLRGAKDLEVKLDELEQVGVSNINLEVDSLLPPIVTSCTPDKRFVIQVGDISVAANTTLNGVPARSVFYISIELEAEMEVTQTTDGQQQLRLETGKLRFFELDSAELAEGLEPVFTELATEIKNLIVPALFGKAGLGASLGFQLPSIDLKAAETSLPDGTRIEINAGKVEHRSGYTVLMGTVK